MKKVITVIACVAIVEALGFAVGMLTREGTKIYAETMIKPPLSPPSILFPIAWTILYALMGIGFAMILNSEASSLRNAAIGLFIAQLTFNLLWCFIFFSVKNYGAALVWMAALFVLSLIMMISFRKICSLAGALQIPYLIWLLFALYLNTGVMILN